MNYGFMMSQQKSIAKFFMTALIQNGLQQKTLLPLVLVGVLNIADLEHFYNIALGVDDYAWQPDGKGFIASSSAYSPPRWLDPSNSLHHFD